MVARSSYLAVFKSLFISYIDDGPFQVFFEEMTR
jgi:hypothetical protein